MNVIDGGIRLFTRGLISQHKLRVYVIQPFYSFIPLYCLFYVTPMEPFVMFHHPRLPLSKTHY